MTLALGVDQQYRYRLPRIADFLHHLLPHMWPERYQTTKSALFIHQIGKFSPKIIIEPPTLPINYLL